MEGFSSYQEYVKNCIKQFSSFGELWFTSSVEFEMTDVLH